MLVRSPTFTNSELRSMVKGSRPDRRQALGISGITRGGCLATALAMASMCAGVVPQQPPMMLRKPEAANSSTTTAISAGVSSYSPKAFGRPALGWAETKVSALVASSSRYGRSSLAPRAQFRPTEIGLAWRTEFQKASVVWPDRVRPEASVMVPEIMIGSSTPSSS
ncbi:hypothetical protein D9M70_261140 [compost metagenome]